MSDLTFLQQWKQSLVAIKQFASQGNNEQLLGALKAIGNSITAGNINGSTAVTIGQDIKVIVNQVLPQLASQ